MRIKLLIISLFLIPISVMAQYNTDRLIMAGRSALYYEDYVLSIQYFNQAIEAKPYNYEPWFYRALAKYYLEDYTGAEEDCSKAISINPFVGEVYDLRAFCYIRVDKYSEAVKDYTSYLSGDPYNKNTWYNRVLCRINDEQYDEAGKELDYMVKRWKDFSKAYSLQAEVSFLKKDTIEGEKWLDKSIKLDPYDGSTWAAKAMLAAHREEWDNTEKYLSKSIHLKPSFAPYYVNRAMARYNMNNLRGALLDYDMAIDVDPENYIAHYNRGLLRMDVGDDNRAITDFDHVLKKDPENVMALFNRGMLKERTGDYRGAIDDFSNVIKDYPDFWTGLQYRASCYRKLGMSAKAEKDEYRILKGQMDKRYGSGKKKKIRKVRKLDDIDVEQYSSLVAEDAGPAEHEYESAYRGKVQNHRVDVEFMPMYLLSYIRNNNGLNQYTPFNLSLDKLNRGHGKEIYISCNPKNLKIDETKEFFALIESFNEQEKNLEQGDKMQELLLRRSIAYSLIQNFADAVEDLNAYVAKDSTSALAFWQRAVCSAMMNDFDASIGVDVRLKISATLADFGKAAKLDNDNPYIYYDRGNFYARHKEYEDAVKDYDRALELNPNLAEAYYNRGITKVKMGKNGEGLRDLSKAGELGLYTAYSMIKKYTAVKH